ncbi:hypothetical protein DMB45_05005 [Sanguibacteroides justesenii]|uniref:Uncharacterized protein n=1 Tax=Sanguibacteroides justesenii TaxID=1547597 RepID=A0AB34R752_9PORP|nr:hypothetical protein IE90_08925 [Sanguibacteroides justesenii]PXZ44794.1 hypothetical protein DMB45_05005 [Sanguibacteroides justesenii]
MNGGEGRIKRGNINKERRVLRAVSGMSGRRNVRAKRVPETRERKPSTRPSGTSRSPEGYPEEIKRLKRCWN